MVLDVSQKYELELSVDRLFGCHCSLFPTGRSGMVKITVGQWRENEKHDPMQVVSRAMGKEKIHYQTPDSAQLANEMKQFMHWFNHQVNLDPII